MTLKVMHCIIYALWHLVSKGSLSLSACLLYTGLSAYLSNVYLYLHACLTVLCICRCTIINLWKDLLGNSFKVTLHLVIRNPPLQTPESFTPYVASDMLLQTSNCQFAPQRLLRPIFLPSAAVVTIYNRNIYLARSYFGSINKI